MDDSKINITLSKTTIKQGNNIRVLTLLTIVYLPLGYVTVGLPSNYVYCVRLTLLQGLFSENHGILPNSAGKDLYAGLVVLFTIVTYGLAWRLDKIIEFLKAKGKILKRHFNREEPDSSTDNPRANNPDEATPVSSRDTTKGSVDVTEQPAMLGPNSRGWRPGWRSGRNQIVQDEEIPLEPVRAR